MSLFPHLLKRVYERMTFLNGVHADICEARVTLVQQDYRYEARVRLLLADKTLFAMHHGSSPDAAIGAALSRVEDALQDRRARRQNIPAMLPS